MEKKRHVFALAKEKAERLGIGLRLPNLEIDRKIRCCYPWHGISVFKGGDVATCPYFRTKRDFYYHAERDAGLIEEKRKVGSTVIGNYLKENILDIWNGERIKEIRKGELNLEPHSSPCDTCYYKYLLH